MRVGYLHTPAVDGQIWLGQQSGTWAKHGLELELIQFTTGLELFQAMIGGSLDVLSTGAVVSNFPARGQGKVFLVNDIEYATAQLWVRDDGDQDRSPTCKGKQISTTTGTTAHVFLDQALRSAKLDPAKDVQIVNQRMAEAVTSFVSGAVPAVALWVPFDQTVKAEGAERAQDRRRLGVLPAGGDRRRLGRAQRLLRRQQAGARDSSSPPGPRSTTRCSPTSTAAAETLQKTQYKDIPLADFKEAMKFSKYYTSAEWRTRYADGTVTKWLQQVTDFFAVAGNIASPVPASTYFDPQLYLQTVKA